MTNKTTMPQSELFQVFIDSYTSMAAKVSDFQKLQMEQLKKIISMEINGSKLLADVKSQEDFTRVWSELLKTNGAVFTQVFLENLKDAIAIWSESFDSSALHSGKFKDFSMKILDFYSQLAPSNEAFQLNSLTRNAASRNVEAIAALKELVKSNVQQFGEQVRNSAEQVNSLLSNLSNQKADK